MELWQLWLISTLTGWNSVFFALTIVCGGACAVVSVLYLANNPEGYSHDHNKAAAIKPQAITKPFAIAAVICLFIVAALPSTDSAWKMIGAYVVTNIDGVGDLPPNLIDAANVFLEQYATETVVE